MNCQGQSCPARRSWASNLLEAGLNSGSLHLLLAFILCVFPGNLGFSAWFEGWHSPAPVSRFPHLPPPERDLVSRFQGERHWGKTLAILARVKFPPLTNHLESGVYQNAMAPGESPDGNGGLQSPKKENGN